MTNVIKSLDLWRTSYYNNYGECHKGNSNEKNIY